MVESRCSVVLVGMVVSGRGAACCRQPMGRCSRFDPCVPGRLGVGRLGCGLFIVGSLSCSSLIGSQLCSPRLCSRTWFSLSSRLFRGLRRSACPVRWMCRNRGVPRAWCWFAGICLPAVGPSGLRGGPYGPCRPCLVAVVVPTLLVSRQGCCFAMCPVSGRPRVWLLCCWHYFAWSVIVCAAQWPACPAVGCVRPWRSCRVGSGCSSCVGPVQYGWACPQGKKGYRQLVRPSEESFEIGYDAPCPALEASSHAQFITWYFAVPFGRPFSCAWVDHMHTPVGGKAPSVPLCASLCSPGGLQGAALVPWCGARARVRLPVVCRIVLCLA